MIEKSCSLSAAESEAVGSSMAIRLALRTSALLIMTSQRSATLSSEVRVSSGNLMPIRSAAARAATLERFQSIRNSRVALVTPRSMFSSALKCGMRLSS